MKLGLESGFLWGIYIMPGPDDLPQQKAIDIAIQAVSERFEIAPETLRQQYESSVSFFDANYKHTGHFWRIVLMDPTDPSGINKPAFDIYISSPAGEVVDFLGRQR